MFCENLHIYQQSTLLLQLMALQLGNQDEFSKKYLLKVIVFCELFTFDILKAGCYNTDEVE